MADSDLRHMLGQIDVPTIVLHGQADVRAPRDVAEALCANIPTSRLVVLAGAGHVSCVEAPEQFRLADREQIRQLVVPADRIRLRRSANT